MFNRYKRLLFVIAILVMTACSKTSASGKNITQHASNVSVVAKEDGNAHGIAMGDGNIYFGLSGKYIFRYSPESGCEEIAVLEEAAGSFRAGVDNVFIYDMDYGPDKNLYIAAETKVLRWSASHGIETLFEDDFSGTYGAAGIAVQKNGTFYVTDHGGRVIHFNPENGDKEVVMKKDSNEDKPLGFFAPIGLALSENENYLYICDSVLSRVITMNTQNNRIESIVPLSEVSTIEYLGVSNGYLYVKSPAQEYFYILDLSNPEKPEETGRLEVKGVDFFSYGIQTFVVSEESNNTHVTGTCWDSGEVYSLNIDTQ
ncbi:MAG: hypothetical protein JXK07_03120 [Spirochaetes bacterium]|nr:hypothetical protein [Spirochaetota bacterium]MBN2771078.1 hypothetical protein [Spirochaetota bacterium]